MTGERNIARAAAEGARGRMHAAESVAAAGRAALAIAVATAESLADSLECFHSADHSAAWTVPHLRRLVADYPEAVQADADALELAWRTVDRAGASS